MAHAISWFEIPVTDYDRAAEFYETVLDREIDEFEGESDTDSEGRYGMFRTDDGEVGGGLAQMDEGYTPRTATRRSPTPPPTRRGRYSIWPSIADSTTRSRAFHRLAERY